MLDFNFLSFHRFFGKHSFFQNRIKNKNDLFSFCISNVGDSMSYRDTSSHFISLTLAFSVRINNKAQRDECQIDGYYDYKVRHDTGPFTVSPVPSLTGGVSQTFPVQSMIQTYQY